MKRGFLLLLPLLLAVGCSNEKANDAETNPQTTAGSNGEDDLATVASYELSMEKVDRFMAANRNMAVAMKDMSPEEREQQSEGLNANDAASLEDMAERMEENPTMRKAIEDAGLSSREYAILMMSMMQSGMAQAVIQMSPNADPDSLARAMQANPKNIAFMRDHGAELQAKQQALEEELRRMGIEAE